MLGGIVFGVGTFQTVDGYLGAANNPSGGEYTILYGAILVGFTILAKALSAFVEYRRLGRIAKQVESPALREAA